MTPMSNLNCRIAATVMSPIRPPSDCRSAPPVTITLQSWFCDRMLATFMLFVTTRRLRWCRNSRATASVLVPMLRNTVQSGGIRAAQARAMAALPSAFMRRRSS